MGNEKIVFKYFTIFQYQQEEAYLCSMYEEGWRLTKITFPGFYHFEKCEPGNVTYRLDYNQEGVKNKAEYVQLFLIAAGIICLITWDIVIFTKKEAAVRRVKKYFVMIHQDLT